MKKRISLLMVVVYIFSCIIMPVNASTEASIKKQQQQVNNELSKLQQEQKTLNSQLNQSKENKAYYDSVIKDGQKQVTTASSQAESVGADVDRIINEINELDQNYKDKTELFKTRMRVLYQNMSQSSLEVLIESKSFSEFLSRLELLALVKANDEKLIKEISMAKENTEVKKQEKLQKLNEKIAELEKLNSKLAKDKTSRAKVLTDLETQQESLKRAEKREDDLIAQSKKLEKDLIKLQDANKKYAGGIMKWPTPGYTRISSPFGMRIHPIYKKKKMHTGIDIDAPSGATIVAANSGKVILAGWNGGYGNCVIIDHGDGIATLYAHQSKILVKVGDELKKGDTVGKVGSTGLSTGPHLHFEVRVGGEPKDPKKYV